MFYVKHPKIIIGRRGEDVACKYLEKIGYKTLLRNYCQKFSEIDIVSNGPDGTLVFFEVKSMTASGNGNGLIPEDNLTREKLMKLRRGCSFFASENPDLVGEAGWQIDLLTVCFEVSRIIVRHYKNI